MEQVIKRVTERDIELPERGDAALLHLLPEPGKAESWNGRRSSTQDIRPAVVTAKIALVSESPVTDGRHVYVYVANLGLWAFDLKGKLAWTTPIEANPIYLDFGTGKFARPCWGPAGYPER